MSGMGYLLLLAALKERENRKRSNASFRRVEHEEKEYEHHTPRVPTESEKIFQYVDTTPELKEFFLKLKEFRLDYNKKFLYGLSKDVSEFSHEYYQELQELHAMEEELYGYDLTVSDDYSEDLGYVPILLSTDGKGFGGYGKYTYTPVHSVGITFNGAVVTPDMLDMGVNPYEVEYNKYLESNPTIDEDIAKLSDAIGKLEAKYNKSLFKKNEKLLEINSLKEKLNLLIINKKKSETIKAKADVLNNLTDEQKDMIRKYFAKIDFCKERGLKLKDMITDVNSRNYEIKQEDIDFLIDYGIKNGNLTQEEVDRVMELMNPEIIAELTEGIHYFPYREELDVLGFYNECVLGSQNLSAPKSL